MQGAGCQIQNKIDLYLSCIEDPDMVILLRDYIESLNIVDANIFVQYFIIGKTHREIAEEMCTGNIVNAKRRIQYKITKLKEDVKKQIFFKE